jgi:hypothetical protein
MIDNKDWNRFDITDDAVLCALRSTVAVVRVVTHNLPDVYIYNAMYNILLM